MLSKFLQFTNHHNGVEVTGNRVKHGVVLGLEILINCFFMEMQSYNMDEKSLEKLDNEFHVKVKKCFK